ncbi:ABC transporter permease [Alkalimonas sp. MEB108]|uniref:ABC transporter permease n=1 Tax=Alkalimonas cellulosilytica TaxID=3058395 RepID=A0ABU7J246_9GAMM|nr:ABC transporter permease [Alkalimonas sp. MEB108]MEE2000097.1 ABC transporter permease [Alkalimonas sp. MEB108]
MISRQSLIVARWEFLRFFKWKQQLISYLLMLAVMGGVFAWVYLTDESRQQYRIAVPVSFAVQSTEQFEFQRPSIELSQQLQQLHDHQTWHAVVTYQDDSWVLYTGASSKWLPQLEQVLQNHFQLQRAGDFGLTDAQLTALQQPEPIVRNFLDDDFKGEDTPEKMIAFAVLILLLIGLSTAFGQILMSITGEKQQRVTEQLYAILTPQQWMDGKVLGHSFSALKAMLTTTLVMLVFFLVVSVLVAGEAMDLSWLNWWVILWLIPFALAGVLLCACFMGAIAASIDDPNTSGKGVVMMVTWLPLLFTYLVIDSPSGWAMTLLSWLPLTSFAAMPVRMSMVEVPWWQLSLSLALLLAAVYYMRRLGGRIFLRGMQMYGKEPSWGDIMRWALSRKGD